MFRTAIFRAAFARSLGIGVTAIFVGFLAAPLVCAQFAWAQDPAPVRIRGTIERVYGTICVVKARDGAELKLTIADNPQMAGIIKASLSDIKQNSFVGVTAMPQPDGSLNAVEVHIFPESMRGTGEGHYPWDLQPQSTMTNANVEQVVSAVDGRTLTLKHKDGEKKITVPGQRPDRHLRRGRQKRHQARRKGLHHRGEAGRRYLSRPRLAGRPRRRHAADVIASNKFKFRIKARRRRRAFSFHFPCTSPRGNP
jgi:hypothetical protein